MFGLVGWELVGEELGLGEVVGNSVGLLEELGFGEVDGDWLLDGCDVGGVGDELLK